jgi:trans-aconitate methyltransferase
VIKTVLAAKGVHFIVTRLGPQKLRSMAFDEKYRRGDWCFQSESQDELPTIIRHYLRNGDLLILGCGEASVLDGLDASAIHSALGIDLSREAIRRAGRHASRNVTFQVADMERFDCPRSYDVILFSESLYYVRTSRQIPLLKRLSLKLKPGGAFVVTLAEATRYQHILTGIRDTFRVIENRSFRQSTRHLVVFEPH